MNHIWRQDFRTVFIDLDGVGPDYLEGWDRTMADLYPHVFRPDMKTLKVFYLEDLYPDDLKPLVRSIDRQEGFFLNLPAIPGSIEGMKEIRSIPKVKTKICTSPVPSKYCMSEKYMWVEKHLGEEWIDDLIFTRDKTILLGDYLIDDKPKITGLIEENNRSFEHVLYRQSYNDHVTDKRSITWGDYQWLIDELSQI